MNQISQEEKRGFFDLAKDVALATMNPINWYAYNPGMFNVTTGSIRLLGTGNTFINTYKALRKLPWVGKHVQNVFKRMSPATVSSLSKQMWWTPFGKDWGYLNSIDKPKKLRKIIKQKDYVKTFTEVFNPTQRKRKVIKQKDYVKTFTEVFSPPKTNVSFSEQIRQRLKQTGTAAGRLGYGTDIAGKAIYDFFGPRMGKIGKATGRFLTRGGVAFLKGYAYFNLMSIAWDIGSAIGNPLGRTLVGGFNEAMQIGQRLVMPELGGNLALGFLSRGAATERARAIQAIGNSSLNARSILGNEAQYIR